MHALIIEDEPLIAMAVEEALRECGFTSFDFATTADEAVTAARSKCPDVIDADGWMHTGDLGIIDEQGYGSIVGRIKDMIIRGGENIYPREIEEFLHGHPSVADVQVVGLPDQRMGEEVCAWIRLAAGQTCTEDEIRDFCRDRIAHYKIPRHIRFVDEFPMTVSGKVQKFVIRERMMGELKLPAPPLPKWFALNKGRTIER